MRYSISLTVCTDSALSMLACLRGCKLIPSTPRHHLTHVTHHHLTSLRPPMQTNGPIFVTPPALYHRPPLNYVHRTFSPERHTTPIHRFPYRKSRYPDVCNNTRSSCDALTKELRSVASPTHRTEQRLPHRPFPSLSLLPPTTTSSFSLIRVATRHSPLRLNTNKKESSAQVLQVRAGCYDAASF